MAAAQDQAGHNLAGQCSSDSSSYTDNCDVSLFYVLSSVR